MSDIPKPVCAKCGSHQIKYESGMGERGRCMTCTRVSLWNEFVCKHDYQEVSSTTDFDGETYKCSGCGHRYRLYYEDMK